MGGRIVPAVWLWFCLAGSALAQSTDVTGRVVDRQTGDPLAGAFIELGGAARRRAETGEDGRFRVDVTGAVGDTLALRAWRFDYALLDTAVVLAAAQGELVLALERRPIRLQGLTVRAGRASGGAAVERALFEREVVPGVVGISQREIRAIPALAEPDVLRSLQALPGVVALNDLSAQLHVWGGAPDQNVFLLDGARIFAPYHMFGLFGAFNADAVERVEFFRNVLPARRGGALSAALEIEQREGSADGVHVDGGVGLLGARAAVRGPLPWADGRWLVAARRTHADLVLDLFGRDFPYAFYDVHGRLSFSPAPEQRLRVSFFGSADRFRMFLHSITDDLHSRWSNAAGSARWTWRGGGGWSAAAEAWASRYRGALTVGPAVGSPTAGNRLRAGGVRVELANRGTERGVRVGVDVDGGRAAVLGADQDGGYITGDVTERYLLPAGYIEAEQWLGPVRLAPGIRLAYAARRGRVWLEPRLAARLHLSDDVALTVGAGRTHQLLSTVRDDRYPVPGAPFWFVHAPGRPVSRADGVGAEFDGWIGRTWQVRVAAYARRFEDVPRWRPVGTRNISQIAFDDGWAEGLEATVRKHVGAWTGWIAYGLARVRLTEAETGKTYYAAWDRRHAVDVGMFFRPFGRLTLSVRAVYGSGLPFWPPSGEVDAVRFDPIQGEIQDGQESPAWAAAQMRFPVYFRFDVGARYRWEAGSTIIEPYASVVNLTARENVLYYRLLFAPPGQRLAVVPPGLHGSLLMPEIQLPLPVFPSIGVEVHF